jgi:hypothetical protein
VSAAGRGAVRAADDFYRTPRWCIDGLLEALAPHEATALASTGVLDPCAGDGAVLDALGAHMPVVGLELDAARAAHCRLHYRCGTADALSPQTMWPSAIVGHVTPCHVVTNPPYRDAMAFVEKAIAGGHASQGRITAMLLRLNWLASIERACFHRAHPAEVIVLPRRPSFALSLKCRGKSKGARGCGWQQTFSLIDRSAPGQCPKCEGTLQRTTTDSCEYGWFLWGTARPGRWRLLEPAASEAAP